MPLRRTILLPLDISIDVLDIADHEGLVIDCHLVWVLQRLHVLLHVLQLDVSVVLIKSFLTIHRQC